jgi:hypothetical protein
MAKSIAELLNNKESRDRILAKAKAKVGGGGLLDLIPTYGPDGQPLDSDKGWALSKKPTNEEIDYSKSPSELILSGRAVLKDGRRIKWK